MTGAVVLALASLPWLLVLALMGAASALDGGE